MVLWEGGLPADLPRWVAAVEYVRAEGLSRASLMRLSLLARRPDFTADDIGLLDRAARRLAQIGTLPRRLQDLEYAQALRELQRAFGPESRNADHPCARFPSFGASAPAPPGRPRRLGARSGGSWGPMEILTPPLTRPGPATIGLAGGVFRAGYCGAFRFPHRALLPASDGRAFGLRRRRHGGTFLIDCSGSMRHHASHQDLTAVLEQAPGATVALYAGLPGFRIRTTADRRPRRPVGRAHGNRVVAASGERDRWAGARMAEPSARAAGLDFRRRGDRRWGSQHGRS